EASEKNTGLARPCMRRAYARQRLRCPMPEPLMLKKRMRGSSPRPRVIVVSGPGRALSAACIGIDGIAGMRALPAGASLEQKAPRTVHRLAACLCDPGA